MEEEQNANRGLLIRITGLFVLLFEKIMPDAFIFAILLTVIGVVWAYLLVPSTRLTIIGAGWYSGVFNIFTFAFQRVMMLISGCALATSHLVHGGLEDCVIVIYDQYNLDHSFA